MNPAPDDALIARCADDPAAFRALVGRHQARVFGFLVNWAGRDAADDLFQETWLRVHRAAPRYEPRGLGGAWIMKIARGVALNHLARRCPAARRADLDEAERLPEPAPGPPAAFESAHLGERVAAAVAALPDEQREIFLLREMAGMSYADAARELGIPLGTALSRMNYALKKLRASLGEG